MTRIAEIAHREGLSAIPTRVWTRLSRHLLGPIREWAIRDGPWASDDRPVFLLVHHAGGGGIGRHIRDLAQCLRASGVRPVELKPGTEGSLRWEDSGSGIQTHWRSTSAATIEAITGRLAVLRPAHIHVHSAMNLPESLFEWLPDAGLTYDWTVHDYYPICPRGHLDRFDGRYCGEPDEAGCRTCLHQLGDYQGCQVAGSIASWRLRFERYLRNARKVFAPSEDVKRRLGRYMDGLPLSVHPHVEHPMQLLDLAAPYKAGDRVRIAVVGTITTLKGSRLLQDCAEDARRNDRPIEFVVVGRTDRDAALARTRRVTVTGPYREDEVFDRLGSIRCHLAFLPSVVPETYMYTLSTVLHAGFVPACLDLGAQAERLRSLGVGLVLPATASPEAINRSLIDLARSVAAHRRPTRSAASSEPGDLIQRYYGFTDEDRARLGLRGRASAPVLT